MQQRSDPARAGPGMRGAWSRGPRIGRGARGVGPPETLESLAGQRRGGGRRRPGGDRCDSERGRPYGGELRPAARAGAAGVADSEVVGGGGRGIWGKIVGAERRGEGERGEVEASTNRGSARIRAWRVAAGGPGLRRL
jgi:hypothetical protein